MTFQEVVKFSGMTGANIRFYESEGFIKPVFDKDGSRIYSEDDLEIINRIKLLRALDLSIDEIHLIHRGEKDLIDALEIHLGRLEIGMRGLQSAQGVCKAMLSDAVQYRTLDAQRYLSKIDFVSQNSRSVHSIDVIPLVQSPWRRFFARVLDSYLYSVLWGGFCSIVLNINNINHGFWNNLLDILVVTLLMLFIEPLLLSLFATTLGKWVLGLRVTNNDGERLKYSEALNRTWTVLWFGLGFNIPIYILVRHWKSYKACTQGETLEWECRSTLVLRDERKWRYAAYVAVYFVLFSVTYLSTTIAQMPLHRGEITVAEFCENYNRLSDYYGYDTGRYLSATGKWKTEDNMMVIGGYYPDFVFIEEDGIMKGLRFSTDLHNSPEWVPSYQSEMLLLIKSFVQAREGIKPFGGKINELDWQLADNPFGDFNISINGIDISCDIEHSGYLDTSSSGYLIPEEGMETSYTFSFSMIEE